MRIIIADDHQMVRAGLRALLKAHPEIEIVAEASNGREAVSLAKKHSPDVVIMDIDMPEMDGVSATRQITSNGSRIKVIALTASQSAHAVRKMLEAGASGYVSKTAAFRDFREA